MISGKVDADYIAVLERRMRRYKSLFEAHDGKCEYCTTQLTYLIAPNHRPYPNSITRDHYIPRCKKGPKLGKNVVAACYRCNMLKGKMTGDTFKRVIALHPHLLTNTTKPIPDPEPRVKKRARRQQFAEGVSAPPLPLPIPAPATTLPPPPPTLRRLLSRCVLVFTLASKIRGQLRR